MKILESQTFMINHEAGFCLKLDGYCKEPGANGLLKELKLAFEYVDGIQHYEYPNPFHKSEREFNRLRQKNEMKDRK